MNAVLSGRIVRPRRPARGRSRSRRASPDPCPRERGQRGYEAWALRLLGEIASHREPLEGETAGEHYHQALDLADQLGMRPLVAHCHLGLDRLARRTGKRQETQEHLATATTMYREMDMPFWLEQAEVEMGGLA